MHLNGAGLDVCCIVLQFADVGIQERLPCLIGVWVGEGSRCGDGCCDRCADCVRVVLRPVWVLVERFGRERLRVLTRVGL